MEPYIDIDIDNQFHHQQSQSQSQQSNSAGLLRFRSAPSSLLSSFKPPYSDFNFNTSPESSKQVSNGYSGFVPNHPQYPKPGYVTEFVDQGGYGIMRGFGNLRAANGAGGDSSRLKPQIDFPTPLSRMPQIPKIGAETTATEESSRRSPTTTIPDPNNHRCRNGDEDDATTFYRPAACSGFPFASSWNYPSESSSGHQQSDKSLLFSGLDDASASSLQNGSLPHRTLVLSHHLSLPKTSAEMAAVEKLLNYPDTIPCKIRAKRGCATHPRSIAERVRRTRISERMKKLQDLVPNMDKQVNTADMLDLAVEYIKELQKQYKALNDNRARCECMHLKQYAAVDKTC